MLFVPAHRSIIGAAVSGTVDVNYTNSWLTDGMPNYPAKTTGAMSLTASPTALSVDVLAVCIHRITQGATINITGDITNTIPTAAWRADGIPYNWVRVLTAPVAGVDSLTLGISGNSGPIFVGEFYAGLSSVFPGFLNGGSESPDRPFPWEGEFGLMPAYDPGIAAVRRRSGQLILTDLEFAELWEVFLSQRRGSRPVLWVPDPLINDAWLCQFAIDDTYSEGIHFTRLEVVEIPRVRWPS